MRGYLPIRFFNTVPELKVSFPVRLVLGGGRMVFLAYLLPPGPLPSPATRAVHAVSVGCPPSSPFCGWEEGRTQPVFFSLKS